MASKKDYEKAVRIVTEVGRKYGPVPAALVSSSFAALFADDNPLFDDDRFGTACADALVLAGVIDL
jgi:hypothetical protein